jgi:hypothetical protein
MAAAGHTDMLILASYWQGLRAGVSQSKLQSVPMQFRRTDHATYFSDVKFNMFQHVLSKDISSLSLQTYR